RQEAAAAAGAPVAVTVDDGTASAAALDLAARSRPPVVPPQPAPDEDALAAGLSLEATSIGPRSLVFPVLGPASYGDGWGACRDGCTRRHVGTDIIGVQMQPLLAAVDGTVTRL